MPIREDLQEPVRSYVLRHVVPKTVVPRPADDREWFAKKFDFLPDPSLRAHLAEAWWQARFVGRLQEALGFSPEINKTFVKHQIVLYASIFEAVIDCILSLHENDPSVSSLFVGEQWVERRSALSKHAVFTYQGTELVPCERKPFRRQLHDSNFSTRLECAIKLGAVRSEHESLILSIYKNRNNIHITKAAASNFKPDQKDATQAFKVMFEFLKHVAGWFNERGVAA